MYSKGSSGDKTVVPSNSPNIPAFFHPLHDLSSSLGRKKVVQVHQPLGMESFDYRKAKIDFNILKIRSRFLLFNSIRIIYYDLLFHELLKSSGWKKCVILAGT